MALTKTKTSVLDVADIALALMTESNDLKDQIDALITPADVAGVWHSSNDGVGSGLDADLLDGNELSAFVRHNTDVSLTSLAVTDVATIIESDAKIDWNKLKNTPAIGGNAIKTVTTSNCGHYTLISKTGTASAPNLDLQNTLPSNCACGNRCFLPDAEVRMFDGSVKKISEIVPGDKVIDHDGKKTPVIGIHTPILANRKMYDIGGKVQTTGDHPIKGAYSWVAIEPELAKESLGMEFDIYDEKGEVLKSIKISETQNLKALHEGDALALINKGSYTVDYINIIELPFETQLYSLATKSGSFVLASGIIVDGMAQQELK